MLSWQFSFVLIRIILLLAIMISKSLEKLHPLQPMNLDNIETFDISPTKKGMKKCTLDADTYKVMKIKKRGSKFDHFGFYAITGNAFKELPEGHYEDEIGFVFCNPGWVDEVYVDPRARECGLATVLTELCMIDPDINQNTDRNIAYNKIGGSLRTNDEVKSVENHLRSSCSSLIGLEMTSFPFSGAYAYFSAAVRMKYTHMVVQHYDSKFGGCGKRFKFYEVENAKHYYDENTGRIEDGKGDTEGSGHLARWYFCKYH